MAVQQYPYTLTEARERLELWKAAEKALADGRVKSYKIGSRELTYIDMEEIMYWVNYFNALIARLNGGYKSVKTVVPRDL